MLVLDPLGERAPHLVFTLPECRGSQTPWGMIVIEPHDDDTGALVLLPWPTDPWTETAAPQVLLDPIRIRAVPSHTGPEWHEVLAVSADELFAVTVDNDLVHLSLIDGTTTVEATGVREFDVSADNRWLAWQDVVPTDDDEEWPGGAVYLRDRTTGTNTHLADISIAMTHLMFQFVEHGVIRLRLGYLYESPERFFFLPDMSSVDVPPDVDVKHRTEDGRWLVGDHFGGPYGLFDLATGELEPLFSGKGGIVILEDGMEVLEGVQCCIDQDYGRPEGKLWFVPWDGERELLAERATSPYFHLPDERILTLIDVAEDWHGSMLAIDPDTHEEALVDERVDTGWKSIEENGSIVYGVSDGDRSGIWLTKLAPAE